MKRIKVLHIITRLCIGGASQSTMVMTVGLGKNNFDVTLASGPQDFSEEIADKWNVNVAIIPDLVRNINPIKDLKALIELYCFIRKNKFDIVHTRTSKAGVIGRISAKLAGVPIIFHAPHGSIYHPVYYGPQTAFLLSRIENFVTSFTDKVICCSESEKRDFLRYKIGTEDKYVTIYWGINQEDYLKAYDSASVRRQLGISQNAVLFGNVARLVPEKGHDFCLEAFKLVVEKLPNAMLIIVGDGPLKRNIQQKIDKLGLKSKVIMTGYRSDVAQMFSTFDISLHTSIWDGAPRTVKEAMLMGKAIIATNVGGIPELIEDGVSGILVAPYDKEALVKAIITLVNDKTLAKRLGETARQHAKEKFSIDLMMKNILALYSEFVKQKIETTELENEPMIYTPCNICGSKTYREICDIRISPIMVPSKLVRCGCCGLFYANPRLEKEVEEEYYKKRYH